MTTHQSTLSLSSLPPIYVLPTHISADEVHDVEEYLLKHEASLTYNVEEARIFIGRVSQKRRAAFDLRSRGLWTEENPRITDHQPNKRRKVSSSQGVSLLDGHASDASGSGYSTAPESPIQHPDNMANHIEVIKLDWLFDSVKKRDILPFGPYMVYSAEVVPKPSEALLPESPKEPFSNIESNVAATHRLQESQILQEPQEARTQTFEPRTSILERAKAEAPSPEGQIHSVAAKRRRRFGQATPTLTHPSRPPKLHRTTTSEYEEDALPLPDPPQWVSKNIIYSCARSTPLRSPNAVFLEQLYKIKEARLLTLDEIGVRAYSTSIAAIAAYPYVIKSEAEVLRLPGCEKKIAALWREWQSSAVQEDDRYTEAVKAIEKDEDLKHISLFYQIWGVGADTARKFYFDQGWKDIDDIVEFGWATLNRVQQIGVKFYDDFQVKIPRLEVEEIAEVVLKHARSCRGIPEKDWNSEQDMVSVIVGGYRRGKELCGDVDIILSHREERYTKDLVVEVISSLEAAGWITHTLTLNTTTSDRNQQTLPYRGDGHGHGFDSLDKGLCVWQDPQFDAAQHEKNPNLHRRVDIIVSSWRTVGCAVLGWSGGTTFERDIRRWVKREKAWKFDSSGVRDRKNGLVLDMERPRNEGEGDTWLDREKRLMEALGIGWRPASERCTG